MCIYIIYKSFLPGTLPPLFCRGAVGVDDVLDVVESLGQRVEAIRDTNQLLAILWTKSYDNNYYIINDKCKNYSLQMSNSKRIVENLKFAKENILYKKS